jgi:transcriptional regulator with XRE-family HTH domain
MGGSREKSGIQGAISVPGRAKSPYETLGRQLRQLRGGISQNDLAKDLGWSDSVISAVEKGQRAPNSDLQEAYETRFNLEPGTIKTAVDKAKRGKWVPHPDPAGEEEGAVGELTSAPSDVADEDEAVVGVRALNDLSGGDAIRPETVTVRAEVREVLTVSRLPLPRRYPAVGVAVLVVAMGLVGAIWALRRSSPGCVEIGYGNPNMAASFVAAYDAAGGRVLGCGFSDIHPWGPGWIQDLRHGRDGDAAIMALDPGKAVESQGVVYGVS